MLYSTLQYYFSISVGWILQNSTILLFQETAVYFVLLAHKEKCV